MAKKNIRHEQEDDGHARVECPQCRKTFRLIWNDYSFGDTKQTLSPSSCPSGGIYDMKVSCPYCDYEEEL